MVLKLVELTNESEIAEYLENGGKLVFMYGPKCPPCQKLKPLLLQDLALLPQQVTMGIVDAQAHRELRKPYGAHLIPFLIVFGPRSDSSSESETDLPTSPVSKLRATLQNSDIEKVRAFLNQHLDLGLPMFNPDVEF